MGGSRGGGLRGGGLLWTREKVWRIGGARTGLPVLRTPRPLWVWRPRDSVDTNPTSPGLTFLTPSGAFSLLSLFFTTLHTFSNSNFFLFFHSFSNFLKLSVTFSNFSYLSLTFLYLPRPSSTFSSSQGDSLVYLLLLLEKLYVQHSQTCDERN